MSEGKYLRRASSEMAYLRALEHSALDNFLSFLLSLQNPFLSVVYELRESIAHLNMSV